MKHAIAIRHVHFEDAGLFEDGLAQAGYALRYHEAGADALEGVVDADLLLVLGGPLGANDIETYPFLKDQIAAIAQRLAQQKPVFGICLGAQLMARALGAQVAPMGHKEIGYAPLTVTAAGQETPLRHLADMPVLHWHGDRFAIPEGAANLAATPLCGHQAFALGRYAMAVQFHPEVRPDRLERWLIGHAGELWSEKIDPRDLRRDAASHGAALERAGRAFFSEWLAGIA